MCQQAIAVGGEFPAPYVKMGRILIQQGRFEEAQAHFKEALTRDPGYEPAKRALEALPPAIS